MARMGERHSEKIGLVRIEVAKVRTDMAKMELRLSGDMAKMDLRLSGDVAKMDQRLSGEIGRLREEVVKMELRLWERVDEKIDGLARSTRAMLLVGFSFISVLVAVVALLG